MKSAVIYERNGWRLTSYSNGWMYKLEDTQEGISAWLQDDDAHCFREFIMDAEGFLEDNCEERFGDYRCIME